MVKRSEKILIADQAGTYGASSLSPLRSVGFAGGYRGVAANDNHMKPATARTQLIAAILVALIIGVICAGL